MFKTVDLGRGVPAATFVKKAKEVNADVIAVSINLSSAKENLQKLNFAIESEGLMGKVNVMIGGAAVTKEDADKICAAYGKTKEEAVAIAKQFMEAKKSS
jgi:methanogenic corrinoid protein MtbC1